MDLDFGKHAMRVFTLLALAAFLFWANERNPNALLAQGKAKAKTKAEAKEPAATPFSTVVRAQFKNWDLNGDGKLTPDEIHDAMARPTVKGEAAAAIATLRCIERYAFTRYEKEMPPF